MTSCSEETTDFHDTEMPKGGSNHSFLVVILTNIVI